MQLDMEMDTCVSKQSGQQVSFLSQTGCQCKRIRIATNVMDTVVSWIRGTYNPVKFALQSAA